MTAPAGERPRTGDQGERGRSGTGRHAVDRGLGRDPLGRGSGDTLRRSGQPEDIAALILGLVRSRYTTGEVVLVDGGMHLR